MTFKRLISHLFNLVRRLSQQPFNRVGQKRFFTTDLYIGDRLDGKRSAVFCYGVFHFQLGNGNFRQVKIIHPLQKRQHERGTAFDYPITDNNFMLTVGVMRHSFVSAAGNDGNSAWGNSKVIVFDEFRDYGQRNNDKRRYRNWHKKTSDYFHHSTPPCLVLLVRGETIATTPVRPLMRTNEPSLIGSPVKTAERATEES